MAEKLTVEHLRKNKPEKLTVEHLQQQKSKWEATPAPGDPAILKELNDLLAIVPALGEYAKSAPVTWAYHAVRKRGVPKEQIAENLQTQIGAVATLPSVLKGIWTSIRHPIESFKEKPIQTYIDWSAVVMPLIVTGKMGWGAARRALLRKGVSPKEATEILSKLQLGKKAITKEAIVPQVEQQLSTAEKLTQLIQKAKPARGKIEKAYTEERAKRLAQVEQALNEVGGEKGYATALSKLKGELLSPEQKISFEPIKESLSKAELDDLYNNIFKHTYLDNWEKISAADGLTKLIGGQIPQPKQLVLLEEVYGKELVKNALTKRALGWKIKDNIVDILNIPRAILASADMSAFLRQGIIPSIAHPKVALKAMRKTFEFVFKPKVFRQWFKDLPKEPLYPSIKKYVDITDPSKAIASKLEEAFISRLIQKIPILGQIIKVSERAYVGFLNKLRVDIFKLWADEFISKGITPTKNPEIFKAAGDVINTFSGRGSLGRLNRITPELNTLFFSPRLIAARFNALNPYWYMKQPKVVRMKALGDFAKFVSAGLTTLVIAKAAGVDVEVDPRSSDFGKIKIGRTRFDIWGGFQQWARVFAQFTSGQRKNTNTGEIVSLTKEQYPFTTRKEILLRFVESKLSPVFQLVNELISGGKTFTGEEITPTSVAKTKFIPLYIQDIADAYRDGGLGRSVGSGAAAFFGVGVQTYEPRHPGVHRTYERHMTTKKSRDIAIFYEEFRKAEVHHKKIQELRKEKKFKEAIEYKKIHPEWKNYTKLNTFLSVFKFLDKQAKRIDEDKTMSDKEKTRRMNNLYERKSRHATKALERVIRKTK